MTKPVFIREKYEWSNNWWNNAEDTSLPRVLLIGDSISVGYGPVVIKRLEGKFNVDRLSNSRAVNDPFHLRETMNVVGDIAYSAIHFNNGLHGVPLSDAEYAAGLRYFVQMLRHESKNAPLIWASSTPVTKAGTVDVLDPELNGQVIRRNALAEEIMKELGVAINNLYTVVVGKGDWKSTDGYHYLEKGYEAMGTVVAETILKAAGK
jgi:lysophospholipase L1-like esterase